MRILIIFLLLTTTAYAGMDFSGLNGRVPWFETPEEAEYFARGYGSKIIPTLEDKIAYYRLKIEEIRKKNENMVLYPEMQIIRRNEEQIELLELAIEMVRNMGATIFTGSHPVRR